MSQRTTKNKETCIEINIKQYYSGLEKIKTVFSLFNTKMNHKVS